MMRSFLPCIGYGCVVGLLLATAGCSFQEAHMQDLRDRVLHSYTTTTPDHLYYVGSDAKYDYYYLTKENQRYRVPQTESVRTDRMDLTNDRSQWVVVTPTAPLDGSPLP